MPDPDLDRLLSALHLDPADDLLWLAVADRLEETGQPLRAELLRLNRRLRGMPEDDERWAAEERVRGLVNGGVVPCVPEIVNSIGMRFVLIPAGTFWMGSPTKEKGRSDNETLHKVTLKRPFWMGVLPVSHDRLRAMAGREATFTMSDEGRGAAETGWNGAVAFCAALSGCAAERGRSYRLPTEAEWEYCCRAGIMSTAFHFGDDLAENQASFTDGAWATEHPLGHFPPNAWGLHDMHGTTSEWCSDWCGDYPVEAASDPQGPMNGTERVVRGGHYYQPAR
ncbi:MAG: formylglycine-generating enzyme family protein, partial [Gemmataceae bacterium]|nr:formylglycine-generating enzyme family protein [Gemmataceae bacterium]